MINNSERVAGAYKWLGVPAIYGLSQSLVTSESLRRTTMARFGVEFAGKRILDVGCGPGLLFPILPPGCNYTGVDRNEAYIAAAKRKYPQGTFHVGDASDLGKDLAADGGFDVVLFMAILHHLDDESAAAALRGAGELLRGGGVVLTLDPVLTSPQHPVARFLVRRDRGACVRS